MDTAEVRARIKGIISKITGLDPSRIANESGFVSDLSLDSLSLLEIAVDVDYEFQLGLPDERYKSVGSLPAMVALVEESLEERIASPRVAVG